MSNATSGGVPVPAGNVFQQAASGLGQAGQLTAQGAGISPDAIAGFQNPYTSQVIDASMGDLNRARSMAMNGLGAQATAAGAFGGSRLGIAEAETNRGFADAAARMAGDLRSRGFDAAAGLAGQSAGLMQQAGQGMGNLANLGFGMGMQAQGQQAMMGAQQQALLQQIINAGRGQFQGWTGAPAQSVGTMLGPVSGVPYGQTQTQQYNPGLFDWVTLGLSMPGGER